MTVQRLESLTWWMIFGGMVVFGLGMSVQEADDTLGVMLMVGGVVLTGAGCVMVWVRSRMPPSSK